MYGWVVSDATVWKSMKRLGITGYVRKQKNPDAEGSEHNRYANRQPVIVTCLNHTT